jgi:NADPH:quinone reductase-like Zn-dependent oxidoreductase
MRRIVRFHSIGGPEVLRLEAAAPDAPGPGEVLLRVQAIGLNNSEAQLRRGDYGMMQADLPSRIGRECSGIVVGAGEGVASVKEGDLVSTIPAFDVKRSGVYGDWCVVPETALARVPDGLTRLEAAAVWQQYLTAYGPLVEYSAIGPGTVVLITAAGSSVGRGAMQMARQLGGRVIATTRTASKRAGLLAGGAEGVIVTSEVPLVERVLELTDGQGFDVCLDPIAGPLVNGLVAAAKREATIFLYGQLERAPTEIPIVELLRKGLWIRGYTLWEITLDPERRERAKRYIHDCLATGALRPVIDRVFRLDEIVEAHRYLESGVQNGKIVIDVEGGGP